VDIDPRQILVGLDGLCGIEMLGRDAGADDIDTVEAPLFGDLLHPPLPGEIAIGNLDVEVLAHLLSIEHCADRDADVSGALEARVLSADLLLHPRKLAFGGDQ
jgi:hypothetical protein